MTSCAVAKEKCEFPELPLPSTMKHFCAICKGEMHGCCGVCNGDDDVSPMYYNCCYECDANLQTKGGGCCPTVAKKSIRNLLLNSSTTPVTSANLSTVNSPSGALTVVTAAKCSYQQCKEKECDLDAGVWQQQVFKADPY